MNLPFPPAGRRGREFQAAFFTPPILGILTIMPRQGYSAPSGVVLLPAPALALDFSLDIEFDDGLTRSYGNVGVSERDGELDSIITLTDALGPNSDLHDLHELYFNVIGNTDGLGITNTNALSYETEYELICGPHVAGGAGSTFHWGVNFGNGAGEPGNGELKTASFTLFANEPLSIADLMESTFASGGSIEIVMATHVQGTSLVEYTDAETVGTLVPEPSTGLLLMTGLGLLAASRGQNISSIHRESK
jgi:hypothetical protein